MDISSVHGLNTQREDQTETSSVVSDGLSQHFSERRGEGSAKSEIYTIADDDDEDDTPDVAVFPLDKTPAHTIGYVNAKGVGVLYLNQYGPNKSPAFKLEQRAKGGPGKIPELSGPGNAIVLLHKLSWDNVCGISGVASRFQKLKYLGPKYFQFTKHMPVYVRLKFRYEETDKNGKEETVRKSYWVTRPWVRQHYKSPDAGVEANILRSLGKEEDVNSHANKEADELLLHVAQVNKDRFDKWQKAVLAEGREDSPDKMTPEPAWVAGQNVPTVVRRHGDRTGVSWGEKTKSPSRVVGRSRSDSQSSVRSTDPSPRPPSPTPTELVDRAHKDNTNRDAAKQALAVQMKLATDQFANTMRTLVLGK